MNEKNALNDLATTIRAQELHDQLRPIIRYFIQGHHHLALDRAEMTAQVAPWFALHLVLGLAPRTAAFNLNRWGVLTQGIAAGNELSPYSLIASLHQNESIPPAEAIGILAQQVLWAPMPEINLAAILRATAHLGYLDSSLGSGTPIAEIVDPCKNPCLMEEIHALALKEQANLPVVKASDTV